MSDNSIPPIRSHFTSVHMVGVIHRGPIRRVTRNDTVSYEIDLRTYSEPERHLECRLARIDTHRLVIQDRIAEQGITQLEVGQTVYVIGVLRSKKLIARSGQEWRASEIEVQNIRRISTLEQERQRINPFGFEDKEKI